MLSLVTVLLLGVAAIDAQGTGGFVCPHDYGFYAHEVRCDQYFACENSEAALKTCGNGLAFDDTDPDFLKENCDYFKNVDCSRRPERAPPVPTTNCDYQHGIFADKTDCRVFYSCWEGQEQRYECSSHLAYKEDDGVCTWMDEVPSCAGQTIADQQTNFKCPNSGVLVARGAFSRHFHPDDCRQFYVCHDGVLREYGCSLGQVFGIGANEGEGECTDPLEVAGCEDYYGDLDLSLVRNPQFSGTNEALSQVNRKPVKRFQQQSGSGVVVDAAPLN